MRLPAVWFIAAIVLMLPVTAHAADEPAKIEPKVREVLTAYGDQFQGMKGVRVTVDSATNIEQQGVKNGFQNTFAVLIEKPNRMAIRATAGRQGVTTVSDGRRMLTEFGGLKRYSIGAAPQNLDDALGSGSQRMINAQHGLLFVTTPFTSPKPGEEMLRDLTAGRYLGEVELNGVKCHRLRLEVGAMSWDAWFEVGGRPQLRQTSLDLAALIAKQQGGELPAGLKITSLITYKNWEYDAKVTGNEFELEPTIGWKRVDSLFESEEDAELHPLVGAAAPPLMLELLAGGHLELKKQQGKVVILDFWATWCGPCVRALPTIAGVAKKFEPQGVAFYAVNLQEDSATVTDFLKEHELKINVALDRTGAAAKAYGASAIPQTVIVGKDGRVQVVHIGAAPNLEELLTKELTDLVADKDLAAKATQAEATKVVGLKSVWSLPGKFDALAGDGRGMIVATAGRVAQQIGAAGKSADAFALAAPGKFLRLFRSQENQIADLLTFDTWQRSLAAQQTNGDLLWVHDAADGLDDVAVVDFDGNGRDEVVVGFNGSGGVLALDVAGKELWRFKEIGNVWHVAAGDVTGDLRPEVVTSSAEGDVYVLDHAGKLLQKIDAPCEALHVGVFRAGKQIGAGEKGTILAAGAGEDSDVLVALAADAQTLWKLPLNDKNDSIEAVAVSTTRPLAAVTTIRGAVHVVDLSEGKYVAQLSLKKPAPVTWLDRADGAPLLVVSTGRQLEAFEVDAK